MERKYRRRWNKLISFLENLAPEKFSIHAWVMESCIVRNKECGTVCCAIGWFPKIFPRTFEWINGMSVRPINFMGYTLDAYEYAALQLNISVNESIDLFAGDNNVLGQNPTPQMLAARLRTVYVAKLAQ